MNSIIPNKYWIKSTLRHNDLLYRWLLTKPLMETVVDAVWDMYMIGTAKYSQFPIFWQIDEYFNCRCGKIMHYDQEGHRILDSRGGYDWIHTILKNNGLIESDWKLNQCLFGQHLLSLDKNQNRVTAVVQEEATALIGSVMDNQYVWVALGEGNTLTRERLQILFGRDVLIFPNKGREIEWTSRVQPIRGMFRSCYIKPLQSEYMQDNTVSDVLLREIIIKHIKNGQTAIH